MALLLPARKPTFSHSSRLLFKHVTQCPKAVGLRLTVVSVVSRLCVRVLRQADHQPVFASASDLETCRLLYHKHVNIMRVVGFTDWVS